MTNEFIPHRFEIGTRYQSRVSVRFNEAYWRPDTIIVFDMLPKDLIINEVMLAPSSSVTKEAKMKARDDFWKLLMSFNEWQCTGGLYL
jgi:hypothetical protein